MFNIIISHPVFSYTTHKGKLSNCAAKRAVGLSGKLTHKVLQKNKSRRAWRDLSKYRNSDYKVGECVHCPRLCASVFLAEQLWNNKAFAGYCYGKLCLVGIAGFLKNIAYVILHIVL